MASAPILAHFEVNKNIQIFIDSSKIGCGAMLGQLDNERKLHAIAFFSKKYSMSERNLDIYELELLALIYAINNWHHYLYANNHIDVYTDNAALSHYLRMAKPNCKHVRWLSIISMYNFEFHHIPGNTNVVADWLSRAFKEDDIHIPNKQTEVANFPTIEINKETITEWKQKVRKQHQIESNKQNTAEITDLGKIDNNSLYKQISRILTGSDEHHKRLREITADYINKNRRAFAENLEVSILTLIADVKFAKRTHNNEILALASLVKLPIIIKEDENESIYWPAIENVKMAIPPFGLIAEIEQDKIGNFTWTNKSLTRENGNKEKDPKSRKTDKLLSKENLQAIMRDYKEGLPTEDLPDEEDLTTLLLNSRDIFGDKIVDEDFGLRHYATRRSTKKGRIKPPAKTLLDSKKVRPPKVNNQPRKAQRKPREEDIIPQEHESCMVTPKVVRERQAGDFLCAVLIKITLNEPVPFPIHPSQLKKLQSFKEVLKINSEGILVNTETPRLRSETNYERERVVMPLTLIRAVLYKYHDTHCHLGEAKTTRLLAAAFWRPAAFNLPGLTGIVKKYIKACCVCPKKVGACANKNLILGSAPIPTEPRVGFAVDFVGPLPLTERGNKHLIVYIDLYSRYIIAAPTIAQTAEEAQRVLMTHVIPDNGIPNYIMSDNAKTFNSITYKDVCRKLGIAKTFVLPYAPWSNGRLERQNKIIADCLRMIGPRNQDWDLFIPLICLIMNNSVNRSIGDTPNFVHKGFDSNLPADLVSSNYTLENRYILGTGSPHSFGVELQNRLLTLKSVFGEIMENEREKQHESANTKRVTKVIAVGDLVLIKLPLKQGVSHKLHADWAGPYRVVYKEGFKIKVATKTGNKAYSIHINNVKQVTDSFSEKVKHWVDIDNLRWAFDALEEEQRNDKIPRLENPEPLTTKETIINVTDKAHDLNPD